MLELIGIVIVFSIVVLWIILSIIGDIDDIDDLAIWMRGAPTRRRLKAGEPGRSRTSIEWFFILLSIATMAVVTWLVLR